MTEDAMWLDGNALAGELLEAFGIEMTDVPHGCQSCGSVHAVGAHRLYQGAGWVLRCPTCGDVALRLVTTPDRRMVQLAGTWRLEMTRTVS